MAQAEKKYLQKFLLPQIGSIWVVGSTALPWDYTWQDVAGSQFSHLPGGLTAVPLFINIRLKSSPVDWEPPDLKLFLS